jgi:hypothetical protein
VYPDANDPEVSVRDRVYGSATAPSEGRRSFAVAILTCCIFIFVIALSCRQATAPGPARNILESGLVTLTEIDQLLADDGESFREFAANSDDDIILLPGYPLDIVLTPSEVTDSNDAELRILILERSSALLYARGIDAFDRTGEQSLRRLSIQGVLELGVGQVSQTNHDRANLIAFVSMLGIALCGAIVAATGNGWGRMRTLGMAGAAGSLPVVLIFAVARLIVAQIGGDDPFVSGFREITDSVLGVPVRNGLIVLSAGVIVVASSIVLARADRLLSPPSSVAAEEDF